MCCSSQEARSSEVGEEVGEFMACAPLEWASALGCISARRLKGRRMA